MQLASGMSCRVDSIKGTPRREEFTLSNKTAFESLILHKTLSRDTRTTHSSGESRHGEPKKVVVGKAGIPSQSKGLGKKRGRCVRRLSNEDDKNNKRRKY